MILINTFGIQDSGGITVLDKVLNECLHDKLNNYLIVCTNNKNINMLYNIYKDTSHFTFEFFNIKNILYRLYIENIIFRRLHRKYSIKLIYNFSGSAQFYLKIPQLIKLHDLSFFSKSVDEAFFLKKKYFKWLQQVLFKRLVFSSMINQSDYIEMQSNHVQDYVSDFVNISNKQLFFKSDINIEEGNFQDPVAIDFNKKIRLIYIVGPHFESIHKNFDVFIQAMLNLKDKSVNFEIVITLTKEQLHRSSLWNRSLDIYTTFLGYTPQHELMKSFQGNTILVSTSIIETLGLHVIEAIQNGVTVIVPNEKYSLSVYGSSVLTYETFNHNTLAEAINNIKSQSCNKIKSMVIKNQKFLISNEKLKFLHIVEIFNIILKK
jgi:glycosyltransferase involved in cell wall biosynthesis